MHFVFKKRSPDTYAAIAAAKSHADLKKVAAITTPPVLTAYELNSPFLVKAIPELDANRREGIEHFLVQPKLDAKSVTKHATQRKRRVARAESGNRAR